MAIHALIWAADACLCAYMITTIRRIRRRRKAVRTMTSCPGKMMSPACTCNGQCGVIAATMACTCLACTAAMTGGGSPGVSGQVSAGGSLLPAGWAQPRASGAGMPGFAERGKLDLDFEPGFDLKPVRGLRKWSLAGPDFHGDPHEADKNWKVDALRGATGYLWDRGRIEAVCNNHYDHPVPCEVDASTGQRCGCGYWAYWSVSALATHGSFSAMGSNSLPVVGLIEGTGRVLIGENGFRSQRAKIVALAPAFSIAGEVAPDRAPDWSASGQGLDPYAYRSLDPYARYLRDERDETERRELAVKAKQQADAWMGVIQDRLGLLYPDARVFATVAGMLACVPPEGMPDEGD